MDLTDHQERALVPVMTSALYAVELQLYAEDKKICWDESII